MALMVTNGDDLARWQPGIELRPHGGQVRRGEARYPQIVPDGLIGVEEVRVPRGNSQLEAVQREHAAGGEQRGQVFDVSPFGVAHVFEVLGERVEIQLGHVLDPLPVIQRVAVVGGEALGVGAVAVEIAEEQRVGLAIHRRGASRARAAAGRAGGGDTPDRTAGRTAGGLSAGGAEAWPVSRTCSTTRRWFSTGCEGCCDGARV